MGIVKRGYGLNDHDTENLLAALWPHALFPWELWEKIYEKFWRGFADRNQTLYRIESPVFPESNPANEKYFFSHIYAHDITNLFSRLVTNIHGNAIRLGLKDLLEVAYEDSSDILVQSEIDFLLNRIREIEKNSPYQFPAIDFDGFTSLMEEKILSIPPNSYYFVSSLFVDTIVVDKRAAIHYLSVIRNYPLKQEVKGITHALVKEVIKAATQGTPLVPEAAPALDESTAEIQFPKQEGMTLIPRSLWEGKKPQQVCDDMRVAGFKEDAPIAHALYYWVGIKNFTKIGTILRGDDISESARDKHARKHWKLAEGRYYTE